MKTPFIDLLEPVVIFLVTALSGFMLLSELPLF